MHRFKTKEEVLKIVKNNGLELSNCSKKHRKDVDIVSAALQQNESALFYIKKKLLSNHKIMYRDSDDINKKYSIIFVLLSHRHDIFNSFSLEMKNDKIIVGKLVSLGSKSYNTLPDYLKEDLHVLDCLLKNYPKQFPSLPKHLQEDREVIKIALNYSGKIIEKLPKDLKTDSELILKSIKTYPAAFHCASQSMKKDKEFFLKAISIQPSLFETADYILQKDRETVKIMIQKEKLNLVEDIIKKYYNEDDEIVYILVKHHNIFSKNIIHFKYKSDKNLLSYLLDNPTKYNIFDYFKEFLQEKEIVLKALPNYAIYNALKPEMKMDKEIVLVALKSDYSYYSLLSKEMKLDEDCFQALVASYIKSEATSHILNHIPYELHNREEIKLIIKHIPWNIMHISVSSKIKDDKDLIKSCIPKSNIISNLPHFLNDREIVYYTMKYYNIMNLISKELFYDEDFIAECFKINQRILENAQYEVQKYEPLFKSKKLAKEVGKLKSGYFKKFPLGIRNDLEVHCYVNGMNILLFHQKQDRLKDIHLSFL